RGRVLLDGFKRMETGVYDAQPPDRIFDDLNMDDAGFDALFGDRHLDGLETSRLVQPFERFARLVAIIRVTLLAKESINRFLNIGHVQHRVAVDHIFEDIEPAFGYGSGWRCFFGGLRQALSDAKACG